MTFSKLTIITLSCFLGSFLPSYSDTFSEKFNEHLTEMKDSIPGIGLISDEINVDGLKISHFKFDTDKQYTIVHPNQYITAEMNYEIDAGKLPSLDLHHYIYGLYPEGPIDCLVHSTGVFDSKGHFSISFKAPQEKGVYQLRIFHSDKGYTFAKACKDWEEASADSVIGIVVVE